MKEFGRKKLTLNEQSLEQAIIAIRDSIEDRGTLLGVIPSKMYFDGVSLTSIVHPTKPNYEIEVDFK
jgi:hypothetical protein